ncbi:apolipoprotein N-acyltransferase [Streptomyces sp. NBC_01283]|uniref:apolipoprotein N-acyltransferase n=1 Tax=Streptomyces sp. NBC_01283 TaxID=2903812 RepID=UPI00352CD1EB|nr:apolipoprotein N-acyltransferase [Streptomyces sp. NBC_01283]
MDLLGDDRDRRWPRLSAAWAAPASSASGLLASARWRGVLAVLAGALPALAFPAPSLWWFAYVALVPWILLARSAETGRRAAIDGWLGGLGFMVAVHHWLLPSLHVFTLVIAALLGLLWAPWGWLVRRLLGGAITPGRTTAALVVLPSAWLMVELVRSWEGLGGPWGLLGSSQWQVEPALRLMSVGGVWLVSALIVTLNTAVAALVAAHAVRSPGASRTSAVPRASGVSRSSTISGISRASVARTLPATAGLVAVAAVTTSAWVWAPRPEPTGRTMRVAVVQPGVMDGVGGADKRLAREEELTRGLAGRDLDLVVWGESSVGYDLAERPDVARRIAALSREVGADILVNVDARRSDMPGIFKSSVLVGPQGPTGDRYDKMRLVPFGEYVPARSLLGWATSVGKAAGEDRRRGERPVVMDVGGTLKVGPLVCFESAFPDMSRHLTREGAQLLLAQSSTSSFQSSWAPEQHASLAAVRAAETGRPMVHATLTGVSAVYGADGERVGAPLGTSASTTSTYDIPLAKGVTPYVRLGDWPVHTALAVLAVLCAAEGVRSLRGPGPVKGRLSQPAPEPREPRARTAHGSPAHPGR